MALNKDELAELAGKVVTVEVAVPELGAGKTLLIRSLPAEREIALEDRDFVTTGDKIAFVRKGARERKIAAFVCDMKNEFLFTQADESDIARWPSSVKNRIVASINQLNDGSFLNAVADAAKN